MNGFITSPLSILDFLLNSGFQATVVVILVLTIQKLFRSHLSPTIRHALWLLVLLRFSLPQLPSTDFSVFNLTNRLAPLSDRTNHSLSTSIGNVESQQPIPTARTRETFSPPSSITNPESTPSTSAATGLSHNMAVTSASSFSDFSTTTPETPLQGAVNPPQTVSQESPKFPNHSEPISPGKFAFVIWLFGVALISLKLTIRTLQLRRYLKRSIPVDDPKITYVLRDCQRNLRTRRKVTIRQTDAVTVPSIYGFLRPNILLPNGFIDSFTTAELQHVFTHELAHLKRLDALWNAWATVLQVLHWPNPIIWYAGKRMRTDQELATDYLVLRTTEDANPRAYGETILKTLQNLPRPRPTPGIIGMADDNRNLRRRFQLITDFRSQHRYSFAFVIILMTPLLLTCLTDAARSAANEDKQTKTAMVTQSEPTRPIESQHSVNIVVTDQQTGNPLSGIPVSYQFGTLPTDVKGWTTTDANGHVILEINNLAELQTTLQIQVTPRHTYSAKLRTWQGNADTWDQLPQFIEFQLERGQRIGGIVKDHLNRPVPQASLSLRESREYRRIGTGESPSILFAPLQLEIRTDSRGRWHFDGMPKQVRSVVLQIKDSVGADSLYSTSGALTRSSFEAATREGAPIDMDSLLKETSEIILPEGNNIELLIIDNQGNPIEGAIVTEYFGQSPIQRSSARTTNRQGQVRFKNRSQHELLYVVNHPDHALNSLLVRKDIMQTSHQIVLHAPSPVVGITTDSDGNPVAGALITVEPDNTVDFVSRWHTVTKEDGTFTWEHAPLRSFAIRAEAVGFNHTIVEITRNHRSISALLSTQDRSETSLEIHVEDSRKNIPIDQFEYRLVDEHGSTFCEWTEVRGAKTAIQGHLPDLYSSLRSRQRLYRVEIRAPGYYTSLSRMVSQREINPHLEIGLHPAELSKRMEGTQILDQAGQPTPGATIYLLGHTVSALPSIDLTPDGDLRTWFNSNAGLSYRTDAQGKLPLMALPAGFRGLIVAGRNGFVAEEAANLSNVPKALRFDLRNVVEGSLTIGGWPSNNHSINLTSSNSPPPLFNFSCSTEADEEGNFRFPGVPHGRYILSVWHPTPRPRGPISRGTYQKQINVGGLTPTKVQYTNHGRQVIGHFVSESLPQPIGFANGNFYLDAIDNKLPPPDLPRIDQFISRDSFRRKVYEYHLVTRSIQSSHERLYPLNISPDGRFIADAVPPGNYRLIAELREESDRGHLFHSRPFAARLIRQVTISEGDPLTHIDLGKLPLEREGSRHNEKPSPQPAALMKPTVAVAPDKPTRTEKHRIRVITKDFTTQENLPNVSISVKPLYAKNSAETYNVQTDQTGIASVTAAPSLEGFFLQAEMSGYVPLRKYFSDQKQPWAPEHEFKLEKGKRIHGRVTDSTGTPIADVEVSISLVGSRSRYGHSIPDPTVSPKTNALGRWHYDGIPPDNDKVTLRFLHPTLAMRVGPIVQEYRKASPSELPSNKHLVVRPTGSVTRLSDTVLVPGGRVSGRIIGPDHRAVSEASIRLLDTCCTYTTSNDNGYFELPGSYKGEIRMLISAKNSPPRTITLYAGPGMSSLDIQLEKGKKLLFDVRDSSNSPIHGASILAMNFSPDYRGPLNPGISTDEQGRGLFEAACDTAMDYYIFAQGFESTVLTSLLPRNETYPVTLSREEQISVKILVQDPQGNPIPDFQVQIGHPTELPVNPLAINWNPGQKYHGKEGTFSYHGQHNSSTLPTKNSEIFILKVKAYGYQPAISEPISRHSQMDPSVITLMPSLARLGMLTDSSSRPLANRRLHVFASSEPLALRDKKLTYDKSPLKTIKTDQSGRFEIPAELAQGTLVGAFEEGLAITELGSFKKAITLKTKGWGRLRGRCETAPYNDHVLNIRPIPSSEIAGLNLQIYPPIQPNKNGHFILSNLPEGTYELFYNKSETAEILSRIDVLADRESLVTLD